MESGAPRPSFIDVLIVDDDPLSCQLLEFILHSNGLRMLSCNDADDALRLARQQQPRLILLDVNMPRRNGFDTCKALKTDSATAGIPVIFITALQTGDAEETGFAVGGVDYIPKPFNAATVRARVNTHLQLRRHQIALEEQIAHRTQSLNDALRELARTSRVKDEFLAVASHELRTPLNGLVGSLHLLKQYNNDQQQLSLINAAQACTGNLSYIVENLLVMAEINAGTLKLVERPFSLRHGLQGLMRKVEADIRSKGLLLDYDVAENVPDHVVGDGYHLFRALLMIFSNAVKFTPTGAISLRVSTGSTDDSDVCLISYKISDTGIGIAQEMQPKLFALFERGDNSINRRHGGFGVGLALANALIHALHGSITFNSQPGAGSIFTMNVPLRIATAAQKKDAIVVMDNPEIPTGKTVLIVEDNDVNLLVERTMLEKLGVSVMVASNGQEALSMLDKNMPNLILMDCQMPVLDGFETTRRIRQRPGVCDIPIIAVTANATSMDRERCFNAGMNDYMQKPINPKHLVAVLCQWLGSSAA